MTNEGASRERPKGPDSAPRGRAEAGPSERQAATPEGPPAQSGDKLNSEDQNARKRRAVAELMPKTPFISHLGVVFDRYEPDDVVLRLPFREDLTNDSVVYHGGVVASVIDTAGAAAAWSNHDFERGAKASTVSLTVNYVGACRQSDLICAARTVRRARELIFTEITATDADGRMVASAIQTYRIAN